MRTFPALEITWPSAPDEDVVDRLMAALDDASPTAVEEQPLGVRVFFATETDRDAAAAIVVAEAPTAAVVPLLVPDDQWAERSQASLPPIRVGRIVVAPPWTIDVTGTVMMPTAAGDDDATPEAPIVIAIQPSMGFGTGHHASTRLCLRLLQRHAPSGGSVLDIGTGSGVLAIAAWRLGADRALGIDFDRDALTAAAENVERNQAGAHVSLEVRDITHDGGVLARRFDLVFANITGAMLQRHASAIVSTMSDGALLVTSGFQTHEREDVAAAFGAVGATLVDAAEEDTWVAAAFRPTPSAPTKR